MEDAVCLATDTKSLQLLLHQLQFSALKLSLDLETCAEQKGLIDSDRVASEVGAA